MLSACSSGPDLQPIPSTIVKVPTYVRLPYGATEPCPEPQLSAADITRGVDALGAAAQWKATARCNAGKLRAIDKMQP